MVADEECPDRDEPERARSVEGVARSDARGTVAEGGGTTATLDDTSGASPGATPRTLWGSGTDSPPARAAIQPTFAGGAATKSLEIGRASCRERV